MENRLIFLSKMFPILGLALFIHDGLGEGSRGFALSYALGRAIITALWLRATVHVKEFRPTGRIYVSGFTLSVALFVVSAFVEAPARFVLWAIGLSADMATPWFTLKHQRALPRFSTSKLPERYGLLMIIVLGESVVGVVNGLASGHALAVSTVATAAVGVAIGFGLWWIYFDFIGRRPPRQSVLATITWSYLHLPLAMGLAATGASVTNVILSVAGQPAAGAERMLVGSVAITLLVVGLIEPTLQGEEHEPTGSRASPLLKLVTALLLIGLAVLIPGVTPAWSLVLVVVALLVQMVYGAWVWFTQGQRAEYRKAS